MTKIRRETDSLGVVEVPADKLWGAQTQRSLEHFGICQDLMPREMITAYAILKKFAANANHAGAWPYLADGLEICVTAGLVGFLPISTIQARHRHCRPDTP